MIAAIVDDNEMDRYLVRRLLARHEVVTAVVEAETGVDFLDQLQTGDAHLVETTEPTLVFMDVNMPRMDGFETAERLQDLVEAGATPGSIVVMMFTSSDNPADKARADAIDIVKGYIVKPMGQQELSDIITRYSAQ